jgi:hypothetical protein
MMAMTDIIVPKDTLANILLCAFRYSLGRATYNASECVEWLTDYWHIMPLGWQEQIQGNIRKAIEQDTAGMACDVEQWKLILELPVRDA